MSTVRSCLGPSLATLLLIQLCGVPAGLHAQDLSGTLRGRILNATDGAPIPGAAVTVARTVPGDPMGVLSV